jgi:hypothetical protein
MARDTEEVPFTAYLPMHSENAPKEAWLLDRAAGGDLDAWGALLVLHQERLKSIVAFRLDPRLRGRIDAADVMQEMDIRNFARLVTRAGEEVVTIP